MTYSFIGLIVGLIMGLTGAGGALISIPLFIILIGASLKEATFLSLLAVILGTGLNLFGKIKEVDKPILGGLVFFGAIGNYFSLPLKQSVPESTIAFLLLAIGIYSLWGVWGPGPRAESSSQKGIILKLALTGLMLGLITTLTGLGGGVLLVPVLMLIFGKTYADALPTSLGTILIISSVSFFLQLQTSMDLLSFELLFFLSLGTFFALGVLHLLLPRLSKEKVTILRKVIFTMVTVYSVGTVLTRSL